MVGQLGGIFSHGTTSFGGIIIGYLGSIKFSLIKYAKTITEF